MSVFADRLWKLRKGQKLSQEKAAFLIGVERETYLRWELGTETTRGRVPKIDKLAAICDALQCDSGYLMGEHETAYYETCDISSKTGLSRRAVNFLITNKDNSKMCAVLNYLLENPALVRDMSDFVFEPNGGIYSVSYNFDQFRLTNDVIHFCDDMKEYYKW